MSPIATSPPTTAMPGLSMPTGSPPRTSSADPSTTLIAKAQTGPKFPGLVPRGYAFNSAMTMNGGTHGNGRFELYYNAQKDAWAAVSPKGVSVKMFIPGRVDRDEAVRVLQGGGPLDVTYSTTDCKAQSCPPPAPG